MVVDACVLVEPGMRVCIWVYDIWSIRFGRYDKLKHLERVGILGTGCRETKVVAKGQLDLLGIKAKPTINGDTELIRGLAKRDS